jgi:hypothetical protein
MRATRPKHSELPDQARIKANTRAYTHVLVKRGVLVKTKCACGSEKVEAHHPDYKNPRLVEWKCRPCHLKHHKENG